MVQWSRVRLPMQGMQEFLGPEDPLEEDMATHSSILAWGIHGQKGLVGFSLGAHKEGLSTHIWKGFLRPGKSPSWRKIKTLLSTQEMERIGPIENLPLRET